MIVAKIRNFNFTRDDYKQTVAFQRLGEGLEKVNPDVHMNIVIAENVDTAVKMLRKDFRTFIEKSDILTADVGWFSFDIIATEVKHGRFRLIDETHVVRYSAVGDTL